jgi:hypothetical protein
MLNIGSLGGRSLSYEAFAAPEQQRLTTEARSAAPPRWLGIKFSVAFLWEHGALTDLSMLGGSNSQAMYLTEAGEQG